MELRLSAGSFGGLRVKFGRRNENPEPLRRLCGRRRLIAGEIHLAAGGSDSRGSLACGASPVAN